MNWRTSLPELVVSQPEPRTFRPRFFRLFVFTMLVATLACGGGSSSTPSPDNGGDPTPSTYAVSGTVTRFDNQNPLQGVVIQFSGSFTSTTTDAAGYWSKSDLSGTVTVTPLLTGWTFDQASRQASAAASNVNFVATAVSNDVQVMFLHHSTGANVWGGGVPEWFDAFNTANGSSYQVSEKWFDPGSNNPYDYWDRWINNPVGADTLESLVGTYKVIVWKHCFPVCNIGADTGSADVTSSSQTAENYNLQYAALKAKMLSYPNNQFLVWTGAVEIAGAMDAAQAQRAKDFFDWVKSTWDTPGDNIFLWDFYALETDNSSSLYMLPSYSAGDSHPNAAFCQVVAPYFCNRIVDVIEGRGDTGNLDGKP